MRSVSKASVAVAGLAGLAVLRFGVRGRAPARFLARALNLPASRRGVGVPGSSLHARLYEASGGRVGGWWFGMPVLVLETTGRRSGEPRRTTVVYARDGERYVVTPANAGVDRTPSWWLNLSASGRGAVIVDGERRPVRAREAAGAERERLWALLVGMGPAIAEYTRFTDRPFPVVVLEPEAA